MDADQHPDEALLSAYLVGDLTTREAEALEAHLADCPACARKLQLAAQLEEAMLLAGEDTQLGRNRDDRRELIARSVVGILAAAAIVLFSLVDFTPWIPASAEPQPMLAQASAPSSHDVFGHEVLACRAPIEQRHRCEEPVALVSSFPADDFTLGLGLFQDPTLAQCIAREDDDKVCRDELLSG